MPLKNLDSADPKILEYWMALKEHGCVPKLFDQKAAASIRTQLGRYRTLAAKQARWFYDEVQDFTLISRLDVGSGKYGIYVDEAQPLPSLDGFTARCAYVPRTRQQVIQGREQALASARTAQPVYNPGEHHHNPIQLSPTGIPMQMPEILPDIALPSQEELRQQERDADRQRNIDLLKKLGFDKPLNDFSEDKK